MQLRPLGSLGRLQGRAATLSAILVALVTAAVTAVAFSPVQSYVAGIAAPDSNASNPSAAPNAKAISADGTTGSGPTKSSQSEPATQPKTNRPPVEVSVVNASRKDVPVYVVGLGTVQASLTIGIHAQVDGMLEQVLFTEGQHVKKGDVLAKIDPRLYIASLNQAKSKRGQDAAMLVSAEKDLERYTTLGQKSFQSQQSIDQQAAKVDQLKAAIAGDDASIATAQTQLDYTSIIAPSDGRIGVRLVDPGNIVHASDTGIIASLVTLQPAAVMFTLPAQYVAGVRQAMARGAVEVTAYDQDNRNALASGTLLLIDNSIDQATATIKLKAMFPNENEVLWPGQFVNARLLIETRKDAVAIPLAAVQRGPKGVFAWVVNDHSIAEPHAMVLGPISGNEVIVTSGIEPDDAVVVDGQYKLEVGARVTIAPPQAPAKLQASQPEKRT